MNFCWCTITTQNIEASIKFYTETVGLAITSRFSPRPGMEIVFMDDHKGNQIELIKFADKDAPTSREGLTIGFEVVSLEDTLTLVGLKGIPVTEGPYNTPKVKYFFVKDPDGIGVQFVEKL